jgi:predicted amidohydrolase YtcJ
MHCNLTTVYEEVDAFVLKAHKAGLQVAMHAIGDAAIKQALNAYERVHSHLGQGEHLEG